jgi:hypothetical protein
VSDPYQVLGVRPDASSEDIRRAYWEQVRAHPPEREPEVFKRIRSAYEQLMTTSASDPLFRLQPPPDWIPNRIGVSIDTALHPEDVLIALQAWGDLGREDFHDDFREVSI